MEKIKELKIGDRVKCIKVWVDKSTTLNQIGTVIKYWNHPIYGQLCAIEFDNYILGHSANGVGKYGFCWNVPTSHLEKVNEMHRSKFINENEVINSEGCIFKVDDYITPTNSNSPNLGKKFKITGFRNNLANTEICAITSTHQPNGIGIDKIELVVKKSIVFNIGDKIARKIFYGYQEKDNPKYYNESLEIIKIEGEVLFFKDKYGLTNNHYRILSKNAKLIESFKLPEKWCIKAKNIAEAKVLFPFFNKSGCCCYVISVDNHLRFFANYINFHYLQSSLLQPVENHKEITFEQFKKYVLNEKV